MANSDLSSLSPEEAMMSVSVFMSLLYSFTGAYIWELLLSLDFEWDFITGRRKFKWPLIAYFVNRYLLLCSLIASIVFFTAASRNHPIDCQAIYQLQGITGHMALNFASINFAIRTIYIWMHNIYVTSTLCLLILCQWVITIYTVRGLKSSWTPAGCVAEAASIRWSSTIYTYAIVFDFIVLCLNVYKLGVTPYRTSKRIFSLTHCLFKQGVIYFIIAFVANLIAVIMIILNLNAILRGIFVAPAHTISTIAACRSVRSLNNYLHKGRNVHIGSLLPFSIRTEQNITPEDSDALQKPGSNDKPDILELNLR
ncbi:hypothetical protein CPB83DRAFT_814793 [Crepidotus variabilis]|uniref:Uncharacterized protein n=1 Tax=Crepidotus variabilis TaxID=179855 RepID=A0A9P6JPQ3_9AGAR|nr:hypothetical protein CPB83DRAFT_814793 [Crepidotus variabilis]